MACPAYHKRKHLSLAFMEKIHNLDRLLCSLDPILVDPPLTVTVPVGTTSHGDSHLICTPATWRNHIVFYALNNSSTPPRSPQYW